MTDYDFNNRPGAFTIRIQASAFRWGRLIGRANLGTLKLEFREIGDTIVVISDTTGKEISFLFNQVKKPFVSRFAKVAPAPYAEWVSMDRNHPKLKLHIEGLGYSKDST